MLQAILYGAGDLRLEQRPLDPDAIAADEVYVETEVSALSTGTDLGNYLGRSTEIPSAPNYPRWVGYSNAGIVRHTGSQVANLKPGDRIFTPKPHQSAFVMKAGDMYSLIPANVSSEQASLTYLTTLGVNALRHARYEPGETVAVVGLGVIGLATCAIARAMGAQVHAVANARNRAELAAKAGAHHIYVAGEDTLPQDIDVVVLTANPWKAFRDSIDMCRYGARISILGFPGRAEAPPSFNPFDPQWFYGKQLTLIGAGFAPRVDCKPSEIRFNLRRNWDFVLESMGAGAINLEPIISHRIPAQRMVEAYELAKTHSKELVAAVFDWRNL
ncbi:MAG: zinc-binding alcohol dehydrogenase [Bryobacterales bacterium]|nr:zinc-binding alcohol dehydrogenase [Bryobacterales bacterium]